MASYGSIKVFIDQYMKATEKVKERRSEWQGSVKARIAETLSTVRDADPSPNWRAGINDEERNFESVYLMFEDRPSGIVRRENGGVRACIRIGAELCYSLAHNGQIVVWMTYPYVQGLQESPPHKTLATMEPGDITEQEILGHVETFLSELVRNENQGKAALGF